MFEEVGNASALTDFDSHAVEDSLEKLDHHSPTPLGSAVTSHLVFSGISLLVGCSKVVNQSSCHYD